MNKRGRIRLNMIDSTDQWLDGNNSKLVVLPMFTETHSELKLEVGQAHEAAKDADEGAGITEKKAAAKTKLVAATMEVIKPLKLLATFSGDIELLNKADVLKSTLTTMGRQALSTRCGVMLSLAGDQLKEGKPYKLTTAKISALENALEDFNKVASSPRIGITDRKEANERLADSIDEAMDILNDKMDLIMDLLETTDPELFNRYKAVREIVG